MYLLNLYIYPWYSRHGAVDEQRFSIYRRSGVFVCVRACVSACVFFLVFVCSCVRACVRVLVCRRMCNSVCVYGLYAALPEPKL